MKLSSKLIAESGSTKTDWCFISNGRKRTFHTQGINPYFLQESEIIHLLEMELKLKPEKIDLDEIHFYGAGINSTDSMKIIEKSLARHFKIKKIFCYSDMLASARATCQHQKGIACILGTGSNTCYYNGKKIARKTPSLGYVLGDEGGGSYLGKKILQHYLHDIFDEELKHKFEEKFNTATDLILQSIYSKPFPNRYLAGFANFIFENRGHFMLENIAEDSLNDLFINHLIRYKDIHKLPVHFTGSVAFYLQDIIKSLCAQYDIQMGVVIQKPMKELIKFHST